MLAEPKRAALARALKDTHHLLTEAGKVIIKSDNSAAVFTSVAARTKRPITSRALKYITMIQRYTDSLDSSICHINTTKNLVADCLSRLTYDKDGCFNLKKTQENIDARIASITSESQPHNEKQYYDNYSSFLSEIEKETHRQKDINAESLCTLADEIPLALG